MPPKKKAPEGGKPSASGAKKAKLEEVSKKVDAIAGAEETGTSKTGWRWKDDDGLWQPFNTADAALLETHLQTEGVKGRFSTTHFSFNKEHKTLYTIDFAAMTQTNQDTKVARSISRNSKAKVGGAAISTGAVTKETAAKAKWEVQLAGQKEWQDWIGGSPCSQAVEDAVMLEKEYLTRGPAASFTTKAFSFNKGYGTVYSIDFESMEQKNTETGKTSKLRRGGGGLGNVTSGAAASGGAGGGGAQWQWWNDKKWVDFEAKDSTLLDNAFHTGSQTFTTKDMSWNEEYQSLYLYDFLVFTQVNCESKTSRAIRRKAADGKVQEGYGDAGDAGYITALTGPEPAAAAAAAPTKGKKKAPAKKAAGGSKLTEELVVAPDVPPSIITQQEKFGPQSLRGKQAKDFGPMVSKDPHGLACFEEMLENERAFAGEWVVFYHSYSCAALIYEVQAAVANVLFRFKSKFATLPRIIWKPFEHIATAAEMLHEFPKWKDRDHNPAFRGVGLCGTSSLTAEDSEAPPKRVFLAGYSIGSLSGVLANLLMQCGVPKASVPGLEKEIVKLATAAGLDMGPFGGKHCSSGRTGHMLQIFMKRSIVNEYVYGGLPFGTPDKTRPDLAAYLNRDVKIHGQVRITANPCVFLKMDSVRMFTFSADPKFHSNRKDFQDKLVSALDLVLGSDEARTRATEGIFNGVVPAWWTAEDQGEVADGMEMSRYMET